MLLLLPPPPTDTSLNACRAAYGPTLGKVFSLAALEAGSAVACGLDIAILCGDADGTISKSTRRAIYPALQKVIASIYRLIVHICAQQKIDLDWGDRITPRVVLVGTDHGAVEGSQDSERLYYPQGPIVTLLDLARSTREWTTVYAVESEVGDIFSQDFTSIRRSLSLSNRIPQFVVRRVPGGVSMKIQASNTVASSFDATKRHYSVAVGGTFDHIHLGHNLLLTATALVLDPPELQHQLYRSLVVGITGDELLKNKKYAEVLESWDQRQQAVYQFLSDIMVFNKAQSIRTHRTSGPGPNENAVHYHFDDGLVIKCVEITDPFGPTITDESISALIISGETRSGGKAVNDRRVEKGWAPLEVFEVDVLGANSEQETDASSDFQSKLSSSEIRKRLQQKSGSVL